MQRWRRLLGSAWGPAAVVGVVYLALLAVFVVRHHYDALSFAHLGTVWTEHDPNGGWGYDGQFSYQLARDPLHAAAFMDNAPFRTERIVYPLVVWAISLGRAALVPYSLLLSNWLAVVATVALLASLLRHYELTPWYSLAYGLYFGVAIGVTFDLAEPLMGLLLALGLWLGHVWCSRRRVPAAALAFGLAALTRETAVLFPAAYAAYAVGHRDWGRAAWFGLLGIVPLLIWVVILRLIFGEWGPAFTPPLERVPFSGMFLHRQAAGLFALELALILVPTLVAGVLGTAALVRRGLHPLLIAWLLSLALVATLNRYSYQELPSSGRIANAAILAGLAYGAVQRQRPILGALLYHAATFPIYAAGVWLGIRSLIVH